MRTFLKFVLVGASGVFVNLGVFALLTRAGVHPYVASPVAIELSILSNFVLHDLWTFRWRRRRGRRHQRGVRFNLVSLISLLVSWVSFVVWSLLLPDQSPLLHQFLAIPPGTLVNYFVNSRWTFRDLDGPKVS